VAPTQGHPGGLSHEKCGIMNEDFFNGWKKFHKEEEKNSELYGDVK
jgi:hypothetical protein